MKRQSFLNLLEKARQEVQNHLDDADLAAQEFVKAFELNGKDRDWVLSYLYDQTLNQESTSAYTLMVKKHVKEIGQKIEIE